MKHSPVLRLLSALVLGAILLTGCQTRPEAPSPEPVQVSANHPALAYSGRRELLNPARMTLGYSGSRVRMRFEGSALSLRMVDASGENFVQAWIDGEPKEKFRLDREDGRYPLARDLPPRPAHD